MAFAQLKTRVITAAVLVVLVVTALALSQLTTWGVFVLLGMAFLSVVLSAAEFSIFSSMHFVENRSRRVAYQIAAFMLCVLPSCAALYLLSSGAARPAVQVPSLWSIRIFLAFAGGSGLLLILYLCFMGRNNLDAAQRLSTSLFPALMHIGIGGGALCFLTICHSPEWAIVWLILVCSANDTAAYFIGSRLGGPKLAPAISPNKTVSGSVGGLAAAVVCGSLAGYVFNLADGWTSAILLSIVAAVAGQLGDLLKSTLKRVHGVKDSGNLLPGHGGMYDRIDAIYACAPVVLFFY